mmetsp:Transcript_1964/g.3440  ORF Transcript_1964/g.3440 Transcript_1964/m.3440 type:complete len:151 (-) Transcript_1964:441-893(-)
MKTSMDFDTDEYKFQPKLSILELVFSDSKTPIGYHEFDLGQYTNKVRDQVVKTVLDLRSDNYPGCQIYIYVNIQLLDPLPARNQASASQIQQRLGTQIAQTVQGTIAQSIASQAQFDPVAQANEIRKKELVEDIRKLEDEKIKKDTEVLR